MKELQMLKPIIFLDIDGVLRPNGSAFVSCGRDALDNNCVQMLNDITSLTGALIVVSSTWRRITNCRYILHDAGIHGHFHQNWHTPVDLDIDGDTSVRAAEIQGWLDRHGHDKLKYVIIDDDPMPDHLRPFHVRTDPHRGLSPTDRNNALRIIYL